MKRIVPTALALALMATAPLALAQDQDPVHPQHSSMHATDSPTMKQQQMQREEEARLRAEQPDAWVLTKVKAQFAASTTVDATDINVDVSNGMVNLTGTVSGTTEKQEAVRLARTTEGVTSVNDSGLRIVDAASDAEQMEPEEER